MAVNSWDGFTETRSLYDLTPGGQITPATLAANADDYAPLHWQVSGIVFLSASAPVAITGFDAVQLPQVRRLWNEGSSTITLKNGSAGSVAANRLRLSGDFELGANEGCTIYYSVVLSRWVLVATSATTGGGGGPTGDPCITRAISSDLTIATGTTCLQRRPVIAAGVSVTILGTGEWMIL